MGLFHSPKIPKTDYVYFYLDPANTKCVIDQNTLKPMIDNDSVGNFTRFWSSGTTTVEGVTYNRTDLAYISNGSIVYNTVVPVGDITPYYQEGGNYYRTAKTKVWGTSDFTWGIWYYPTTLSQRGYPPYLIDWKESSAWNSAFYLGTNGVANTSYRLPVSPFSSTIVSSTTTKVAVVNQWNFTLVRRQSGVATFFHNGEFSSNVAFNVDYAVGGGIGIGWGSDADAVWGCLNGKIGPVLTYTTALTNAEITQCYNALRGRYGL